MRILLYSKAFHPMVGGIETVSATLAEQFTRLGHECEVLTPIANAVADDFPYRVHRHPGIRQTLKLIAKADIVLSKGASLALVPYCLLLWKPFIWVHSGYQASCIDGLGWVDGEAAPLTPKASLAFHYRRSGLRFTLVSAIKLYVRRFVSKHLVAMNVAVSDWVMMRQPFKRQIRIHNPFPLDRFADHLPTTDAEYDFLFLGRLVSEKGVATLIKALARVAQVRPVRLLIIGEGSWRNQLEALAQEYGVKQHIVFAGRQTGTALVELIRKCRIAVIPSEWEEPMGVVALELLAAAKPLIVSRHGGLAECVGDAALLFDNGNEAMLAECMSRLLDDVHLQTALQKKAQAQLEKFNPERLASRYLDLFESLLQKKG
ncbi:MAG: glycosyltransferase family 4 protein [Acidobacteria bacterium]|nr:glycosyltransferase family 4 protein [Acidobacteriota bacterium]